MNLRASGLWQQLVDAGAVRGSSPAGTRLESPWYVRAMLGFAGWLAALMLLGFIAAALSFIFESEAVMTVTGAAMLLLAWVMLYKFGSTDFSSQFALAISFTGQFLFAFGIFQWLGAQSGDVVPWIVVMVMQGILAMVMPSDIHRLWSSFAAAIAFYMAMYTSSLGFLPSAIILGFAAWYWLDWPERGWLQRRHRLWAYGGMLAVVVMDMATGLSGALADLDWEISGRDIVPAWAGQVLSGFVLVAVVWRLLRRSVRIGHKELLIVLAATAIMVLVSFKAPGLAAGLCIAILGFANGNRVLTGLGLIALVLYASSYYYSLETTLLVKSQVMAATGLVLLAARWLMLRLLFDRTAASRAQHPGGRVADRIRVPGPGNARLRAGIALATCFLILAIANFDIAGKERQLAQGRLVYLELAPVDPRSLMQGDYMALDYAAARSLARLMGSGENVADGKFVAGIDKRNVARFIRLDDGSSLSRNQILMRYRLRNGRVKFASNAFFFQEGTADKFENARYGAFRVGDNGELLLTGLFDEHLNDLSTP